MAENTFTDPRDGQTYQLIELNGATWMAENLNFEVDGSWWYKNKEANGKKYGRLYAWDSAIQACPPGWRLPTDEEWMALIESVGGMDAGYEALTEGGESGLNIQLCGYRNTSGYFGRMGAYGGYWSSTEKNEDRAWGYNFDDYYGKMDRLDGLKISGRSCRCVKEG